MHNPKIFKCLLLHHNKNFTLKGLPLTLNPYLCESFHLQMVQTFQETSEGYLPLQPSHLSAGNHPSFGTEQFVSFLLFLYFIPTSFPTHGFYFTTFLFICYTVFLGFTVLLGSASPVPLGRFPKFLLLPAQAGDQHHACLKPPFPSCP